jgi:hypothetical protein
MAENLSEKGTNEKKFSFNDTLTCIPRTICFKLYDAKMALKQKYGIDKNINTI